VLVGADHRAIDILEVPVQLASRIGVRLHRRQERPPDASLLPAGEATGDRAPRAIAFGQIAPGSPGAQNPEHPVENAAMIDGRPTSLRFLWGEQRLEPLPLRSGQGSSVHTYQYTDVNRVCKHYLVGHIQPYLDSLAYRINSAEGWGVFTGDIPPC
jgi:hypothetical protein